MPPVDTTPQSTIRYLTRILAILATENGGELRIKRAKMRKLEEESFRLFEDVDDKKDELVLRFDSKHVAVYPVEAECQSSQPPSVVMPNAQPRPAATPVSTTPGASLPFTDDQLARAERKIAQMRNLHAIRSEKPQPR